MNYKNSHVCLYSPPLQNSPCGVKRNKGQYNEYLWLKETNVDALSHVVSQACVAFKMGICTNSIYKGS